MTKATVEFIKQENVNVSIKGYIDFYNVHFDGAYEFCDFSVLKKVTPIEICLKIFLLYFHVIYHQKGDCEVFRREATYWKKNRGQ